ncbi:N4-gp56 family major capsid protein [Paracidovorax avenae]|nr:N4-gp56 family major capsid protein [Paracidovorax avenae]
MIQQAVGVFALSNGRNTQMNHLTGKFPQEADAAATVKGQRQTSSHYPIVKAEDLGQGKGDEVKFHLLNPSGGKPIMGSKIAEGKGVGTKLSEDRLRVNQARFPVDMGDVMTQIRSPVNMRKMGRPIAQSKMDRYIDQSLLTHMAGARGFHNNFEWIVPTETDPDFKDIMVNPVKAPSKNRHFIADGGSIQMFKANAGEIDLTTSDLLKMDVADAVRQFVEQIPAPPPPVIFDGDEAATDSPIRVMLVSPAQYSSFATDPAFRQFQAAAYARANQAKRHPLFLGDVGLWNGILIVKMPKPIRFYAGDKIRYATSYETEDEGSVIVPSSFGDRFAVDRAILLGGQAVGQAFAASIHSGMPFFWSEVPGDHGDKLEILIGAILGMSKIRFEVDHGDTIQVTDHGVAVLDTAVPIIGPRM